MSKKSAKQVTENQSQIRKPKGKYYKSQKKYLFIASLTIALITFLVYLPALQNDFVNIDDGDYVFNNTNIRSFNFAFLKWSFGFQHSNWHPLTWFSHAIDYQLWGLKPLGHHLSNIIIHSINTFLVFLLVYLLINAVKPPESSVDIRQKNPLEIQTLLISGITALMFGIHPLHVESVAWVAERKDVLCAFFFLLSIIFYIRHATLSNGHKFLSNYRLSLLFFALSLMSKPMAVTLPVVLLILDIYPLNRIGSFKDLVQHKNIFTEKIPFFIMSALSSILTMLAQAHGGAVRSIESYPLDNRIINALKSLFFYLQKMLLPHNLSPFYPYPKEINLFSIEFGIPIIIVLLISIFCIVSWKKGYRIFGATWAFYVITLLPVIGIIQVGEQAAADRYTYIPSLGPFLLFGVGITYFIHKIGSKSGSDSLKRPLSIISVLIITFVFGFLTNGQIKVWKDTLSYWSAAIDAHPNNEILYEYRSHVYARNGDYASAIKDTEKAISLNRDFLLGHVSRGGHLLNSGQRQAAINNYTDAMKVLGESDILLNNRATAYFLLEDFQSGIADLKRALELNPKFFNGHFNLCQAYIVQSKYQEAIDPCTAALEIKPGEDKTFLPQKSIIMNLSFAREAMRFDFVHYLRGAAYLNSGNKEKAMEDFNKAISINPSLAEAFNAKGVVHRERGDVNMAIDDFSKAIQLNRNFADAYFNRGELYLKLGRNDAALSDIKIAAKAGNKRAIEYLNRLKKN